MLGQRLSTLSRHASAVTRAGARLPSVQHMACRPDPLHSGMHTPHTSHTSHTSASARDAAAQGRPQPVLLLDIMDTIVVDPFFTQMPKFFNMSFEELLRAKHPSAWLEFERDEISEQELYQKFFSDGRQFDGDALRQLMIDSYHYIDGMESLLGRLKGAGLQMHAMSNYPRYYEYIEQKLRVSRYLEWTFVSCTGPMRGLRKPAREAYDAAATWLQLPHDQLIFVDDRKGNVDAAVDAGMDGILFKSPKDLELQLRQRGLLF